MDLKNKKVLVTGADGFIGSHLTEKLVKMGCSVKALSYYNSFNNWGWLDSFPEDILKSVDVVCGDIKDPHFVKEISKGIDVIFHLAALIAIPYSYIAPDSYVQTNVTGTLNVMQAARENGAVKIVHTSTSEVYGTALYVPIDEKHPLQPQSPYSASKIGADMIALSFYNAFKMPVSVIRPFNAFGPRQSMRAVIPTLITQIISGKKQIKLGALSPRRDFNYVKNTVDGFIKIAESEKSIGEVINIGSGEEHSIGELIDILKNITGAEFEIICDEQRLRPAGSEVERLLACNKKASELIGWRPGYTFSEGLSETVQWFRNNMEKYKVDLYNV
ncbi:MAG: NAD-dependent 4,6-dehydratase LegB [Candidatus Wallbacteria bacterium]